MGADRGELQAIQQQLHALEARSARGHLSPLFVLCVGALLGAVIATVLSPADHGGTDSATTYSAAAPIGDAGGSTAGPLAPGAAPEASPGAAPSASSSGGGMSYASPATPAGASNGSTASAGAAGSSSPAAGSADSAANNGGIRGVTPTSVKIGLFCIDTTAFKAVYPNYYTGPCTDYLKAQVVHLQQTGQDVINGRKVDYVVRALPVTSSTQAQGQCDQWAQQDKFFAVVGDYVAYECFAQQYGGPTVNWSARAGGSVADTESALRADGPYYFQVGPVLDQVYRNMAAWAHARGYLKGHRIGIHYPSQYPPGFTQSTLIAKLNSLGYQTCPNVVATGCIAATTTYTTAQGDLTGNSAQPDNEVAVQKFIAAKVDLVIPLGGSAVVAPLTKDSQQQNFHPKWLAFDDVEMTTDSVSQYFEPSEFDQTPGVTFYNYGQRNAGLPLSPAQAQCIKNYEEFAHTKVDYQQKDVATADPAHKPESTPYHILKSLCDLVTVTQTALQAAGHTLTPATMKAALEHIPAGVPGQEIGGFGWTPTRHWGGTTVRETMWHRDCLCYKVTSGPQTAYSG